MALRIRRGTDAQRSGVTFEMGEIVWTTDGQQLFVGDGLAQGGIPVIGAQILGYGLAYDSLNKRIEVTGLTTDDVTQGTNNKYFSTELAVDAVGSALVAGNATNVGITFTYSQTQDDAGRINATVALDGVGITSVEADTSPVLGANLDLNENNISGLGNINITGDIAGTTVTNGTITLDSNSLTSSSTTLKIGDSLNGLNEIENYSRLVSLFSTTSSGALASSGSFENKTSRGTTNLPTACQTGDYIGGYGMAAYNGSTYDSIGVIVSQLDTVTGSSPNPGKVLIGVRSADGPFIGASLDSRGVFESQSFRVTPFADGAARDLGLPTGVVKAGMICFLTDVKKLQINTDGTTGTWVDLN